MTNDPYVDYDAAYVMGALSAPEQAEFESHLATCDDCTASVRSLRPVSELLGSLPAHELGSALEGLQRFDAPAPAVAPVPDTLLPRMLREVRRSRLRRRWITSSVAAAVAACLITVTVLFANRDAATPAGHAVAMQAVSASALHATADVQSVGWGTRIDLRCKYDQVSSYPRSTAYILLVTDRSGAAHQLGSWVVQSGSQPTTFRSGTALHRSDIASVQITTTSGQPLLDLSL